MPKIDTLLSELETLESTFSSRMAASDIEGQFEQCTERRPSIFYWAMSLVERVG